MLFKHPVHIRHSVHAAFLLSSSIGGASAAVAHEAPKGWTYPLSCCSNYDCKQVSNGSVRERPEGYVISTGEVVAYTDKRIRTSPDGDFHWCAHQSGLDAGRTICLFVPSRGF